MLNRLSYIISLLFILSILSCDDKQDEKDLKSDFQQDKDSEESAQEDIYYLHVNNNTPYTCYVDDDEGFLLSVAPNARARNVKISTDVKSFLISYKSYPVSYAYHESVPGKQGEEYVIDIKDPNFPECEKTKTFSITIKNNEPNTYKVYNNNDELIATVLPNATCTFTLPAGEHELEFVQDPYFFNIYWYYITGNTCDEKSASIPEDIHN